MKPVRQFVRCRSGFTPRLIRSIERSYRGIKPLLHRLDVMPSPASSCQEGRGN